MSPEALTTARAALTGSSASWLVAHGFTFVCTERVYPPPPKPHLTWWGWASTKSAAVALAELAKAFPGSFTDAKSLSVSFTAGGASRPTMVAGFTEPKTVAGQSVSAEGLPMCKEPLPKGTNTFLNLSELP